jgi:hypothetical protein
MTRKKNMPKLILSGVSQALYDNTMACATLHYGTAQKPQDHLGKPINDETSEFAEHLITRYRSLFNEGLKNSNFIITDITYENNSSFPFLGIVHRDSAKEMTKEHCEIIQKLMQHIVNLHNKIQSANSEMTHKKSNDSKAAPTTAAAAGMFAKPKDSKEDAPSAVTAPRKSARLKPHTSGNSG